MDQTLGDLVAVPPQAERMRLYHRVVGLATGGKPVVRSLLLEKSTPQFNDVGRAVVLRMRTTTCIDADGKAWQLVQVEFFFGFF